MQLFLSTTLQLVIYSFFKPTDITNCAKLYASKDQNDPGLVPSKLQCSQMKDTKANDFN